MYERKAKDCTQSWTFISGINLGSLFVPFKLARFHNHSHHLIMVWEIFDCFFKWLNLRFNKTAWHVERNNNPPVTLPFQYSSVSIISVKIKTDGELSVRLSTLDTAPGFLYLILIGSLHYFLPFLWLASCDYYSHLRFGNGRTSKRSFGSATNCVLYIAYCKYDV